MSAPAKERAAFIAELTRALPNVETYIVISRASRLMRLAATHGRLAEEACNGHPAQGQCAPSWMDNKAYWARVTEQQREWDARIEREEKRTEAKIAQVCDELGLVPYFGGDPRGYTVKVKLPNGAYNTWGGREDGWGIPQ